MGKKRLHFSLGPICEFPAAALALRSCLSSACLLLPLILLAVGMPKEAREVGLTLCRPHSRESLSRGRRRGAASRRPGRARERASPVGRH